MGLYPDAPKLPCVVGYEVAGTVDALGEGGHGGSCGRESTGPHALRRVCRYRLGAYHHHLSATTADESASGGRDARELCHGLSTACRDGLAPPGGTRLDPECCWWRRAGGARYLPHLRRANYWLGLYYQACLFALPRAGPRPRLSDGGRSQGGPTDQQRRWRGDCGGCAGRPLLAPELWPACAHRTTADLWRQQPRPRKSPLPPVVATLCAGGAALHASALDQRKHGRPWSERGAPLAQASPAPRRGGATTCLVSRRQDCAPYRSRLSFFPGTCCPPVPARPEGERQGPLGTIVGEVGTVPTSTHLSVTAPLILSAAKDLCVRLARPFAALRACPERSEGVTACRGYVILSAAKDLVRTSGESREQQIVDV